MRIVRRVSGGLVALAAVTLLARGSHAAQTCPSSGAALAIRLEVTAITAPVTVDVYGYLLEPSCGFSPGLDGGYARSFVCDPAAQATCALDVAQLWPGAWAHGVVVSGIAGEPQRQWRRTLLLDRSAGTHALTWRIFASVFTVSSLDDATDCTGCLRAALSQVTTMPPPALIQFAPHLRGAVVLAARLPPLRASDVTFDAIAPDGEPWQRTIDGNGLDEPGFLITGARNTIVGLRVTNIGGNNDVVVIDGGVANNNLLDHIQVTGRALTTCGQHLDGCVIDGECHTPTTDPPEGLCGDDGISIRRGAGTGGANVIQRSEVSGAYDKGIKATDQAVVVVEASHIHDNRDGGIQATLSGSVQAHNNLIEHNRGTKSASGLAANGPSSLSPSVPATMTAAGNLSRGNSLRGISVRSLSQVTLTDDFVCGNGAGGRGYGFGVEISDLAGLSPTVTARGLVAVYNTDGGVSVAGQSRADFGTAAAPGANAFTANGPADVGMNVQNLTAAPVSAVFSQWEHCGPKPVCDDAAIAGGDIAGDVVFSPALAHRRRRGPHIDAVEPSFGSAGDLVRIYGSGFNAIDGQPRGGTCDTVAAFNRCLPMRGNCVRIGTVEAEVVAVTPTMVAVRVPSTCVAPTTLSVRALHARGRAQVPFCVLPNQTGGS